MRRLCDHSALRAPTKKPVVRWRWSGSRGSTEIGLARKVRRDVGADAFELAASMFSGSVFRAWPCGFVK